MAGYKQSILDLGPKLFLTFDGDFYDPTTRRLINESPPKIIDESGEGNDGDLILDDPSYVSYRMGDASMVELEIDENKSMTVGEYVPLPLHPSVWAKNYISIPHSSSFQFPNLGSYSVGFFYRKEQRDSLFFNWLDETYPDDTYCSTSSPVIRKGLVLEIIHEDSACFSASANQLTFKWLVSGDGLTQESYSYSFGTNVDAIERMQENNHFFVTWNVKPTSGALFQGTIKIYHNGRIVHSKSYNYFSAPPVTNVSSPWELFGTGAAGGVLLTDRCKSPITLDQVCVFDRALSEDEIATLFKKTRTYNRVVLTQSASRFYPMSDFDTAGVTTLEDLVDGVNGTFYGISEGKVLRRYPGPQRIPESYSVQFLNDGMAHIESEFVDGNNFTIAGWFKTSYVKRGLIIGQSTRARPYWGTSLFINQADGDESFGRMQLTVAENLIINSIPFREDGVTPIYYNDDTDHYFVIRRVDNLIEFWLDNIKQGSVNCTGFSWSGVDGGISLMGYRPGDMWTNGNLSLIEFYDYALSEANMRARYNYGLTWRISGSVTLQGTPFAATIRAMRHRDGELVQEVTADPSTGYYMLRLYDSSWIDLVALSVEDTNILPRVFGPIVPRAHEDPPVV